MSEELAIKIGDSENSSMIMMKQLANNDLENPVDINGEQLMARTKLFVVAQARNSLNRIIKLTNFLEKLEDKFIEAVNNRIENEPESITMLSMAMETISKCLADANETVSQVLKDDRLQSVVFNTTNIITPDGQKATVLDADSRDAIRNLAGSLLSQLSKFSEESEVIDVEEQKGDD
jgi:hypothetical protein